MKTAHLIIALTAMALASSAAKPRECDPQKAVCYEIKKVECKWGQCQEAHNNCVTARAAYPHITAAPSEKTRDAINRAILDNLTRSRMGGAQLPTVEDMLEELDKEYRDNEGPEYAFGWEYQMTVEVDYNAAGLFCISMNEYAYTGGAHPNSATVLKNFETTKGRELKLEDIIERRNLGAFTSRAEAKFRKERGLSPKADLAEAGYFPGDGKFELPRNFAIAKQGITLLYNPYEAASYAEGHMEIKFKWEEIQDLMVKQGPVKPPLP